MDYMKIFYTLIIIIIALLLTMSVLVVEPHRFGN